MKMKMKVLRKTIQQRKKSIAKKSANKASDSDFYIRKVYEHLKLSFSIEKQKKLFT